MTRLSVSFATLVLVQSGFLAFDYFEGFRVDRCREYLALIYHWKYQLFIPAMAQQSLPSSIAKEPSSTGWWSIETSRKALNLSLTICFPIILVAVFISWWRGLHFI